MLPVTVCHGTEHKIHSKIITAKVKQCCLTLTDYGFENNGKTPLLSIKINHYL